MKKIVKIVKLEEMPFDYNGMEATGNEVWFEGENESWYE